MKRRNQMVRRALFLVVLSVAVVQCVQLNVDIDHDLTQPTYGLEGKTSSAVHYDDRNGLNLKGTISDLLGPPIKIANGMHSIFKGHNMAGLGTGLKTGGAMLGFDAKVLEAAGGGLNFKNGLLTNIMSGGSGGSVGTKSGAVQQEQVVQQTKGQQIGNIIELPVKIVQMKDMAASNVMNGLGQMKQSGADAVTSKGHQLYNQGQNLKTQGLNQIVQGAQEGVKNIGNMMQKTSDNLNTAFKLLPIVWDMQQQQQVQQIQQDAIKGQQQQQIEQAPQKHIQSQAYQMSPPGASSVTGGSLFGGLTSLIPGMGGSNSNINNNMFGMGLGSGGMAPNSGYAAILNSSSPLTNLLMNPRTNPFLFPLAQGPFGQAMVGLQPIGTQQSQHGFQSAPSETYDFNFLPGLRYRETVSSQLPFFNMGQLGSGGTKSGGQQLAEKGQVQHHSEKGQQVQHAEKGQHHVQESIKGQQQVQQSVEQSQQAKSKN